MTLLCGFIIDWIGTNVFHSLMKWCSVQVKSKIDLPIQSSHNPRVVTSLKGYL